MNFVIFGIPIHFCGQELTMLMLGLTSIGGVVAWVRSKFKKHEKAEVTSHHECCHPNDKHEEGN